MAQRNSQNKYSLENLGFSLDLLLSPANEVATASDQLKLGIAYFQAYYLEDNCLTAFKWIKLSAEQGNMEAQFRLADLYSLGLGTSRSHTEAYKWYTKAAIQGYKKALIRIHNLYQEDIKMHCRGRLNSEEEHRKKPKKDEFDRDEKTKYYYRELYEQRLDDHKLVLNYAVDYYTTQFEKYKASNQDDPEVLQNLGFLYQHGYGVKKYDKWAIEYYTKAAEQGYIDSQYQLGCLYQKNTDIKFNYKKAFRWYSLAAHGGNTAAQNCLAYFYEKGLGTDIDYQNALSWYTKAAESDHSGAQLNLGRWYRKGDYVDHDYGMAFKWYTLAARQGNSAAQNCLAQLYQTGKISHLTHVEYMLEDCICGFKKGHSCSKLQLDILKLNDPVLVENIKKLAKRALVGDGGSMYQIGLKYYNGTDFAKDKHVGFKWIKNAADRGHEEAIFRVIKMYEEGDTVVQDYHKAAIWTKKVSKNKNSKVLCDLGILYNEGKGVRNDPLEASKWFTLSAEIGNSEAQYQLGCLRQEGRGLRKNEEEASELFKLSAKQGNPNGCYKLSLVLSKDKETVNEREKKYDATTIKLLKYSSENGSIHAQYKLWKIYHDKKIKLEADVYFDMLMSSNNVSVITEMVKRTMYYNGVSVGYINYFNLLKKAANLGITAAQKVFRTYLDFTYNADLDNLVKLFTFISYKGISSMEYHIARIYENAFLIGDDIKGAERDTRAVYWYDVSAKKGDSRAQVKLGILCEEGKVVNENLAEALSYYNLACKKRNKHAIYRLACLYLDGRGVSQDLEKAFQLFSQASDMGQIDARKILILPHNILDEDSSDYKQYQQIAVEINDSNRTKMLEKMAESGLVAVQYRLGAFYEDRYDSRAIEWYTLAAQNGVTDACYRLGVLYEEGRGEKLDYKKAMSFYEKAVRNEHEDSMYRLAQMYLYGRGTEIDYKKAYELYSRAAKIGHVLAYNILDFNLTSDKSLPSNESNHTLLMFRCIAEEGDAESQYKLGYFYERILNEQNYEEAAKWYSMAVDNSHAEAMYRLGLLYETRSDAMQNYKKAVNLYNQAYNLGNYDALYRLGTVYQYGVVADTDPERAIQYYTEAATNGHLESQHKLGKLYEEGLFTEKDTLKALKWYTRAYLKGYNPARTNLYANYDELPYEKYFFDKRHKILLSVASNLQYSDNNEYSKIYGCTLYKLGIDYFLGNVIAQNYDKAWRYFRESADRFHNNAAESLTNLKYGGDRGIFLKVVDMYETLSGDLKADRLYALGMLYYNGVVDTSKDTKFNLESMTKNTSSVLSNHMIDKQNLILEKDYSKAIFYLEKVFLLGFNYDGLHFKLAEMYAGGFGAKKSIEKVIEHYTKAYSNPNYFAFEIAELYHFDNDFCDYSEAIEWYEKAAKDGYGYKSEIALNILGLIYKSGTGVNQDYINALHYFRKSASCDNRCACYNLGIIYYHGQGIKKDYSKAYRWFKAAAEQRHAKAQMYLADMYLTGCGVKKDITKAKKWYSKASYDNDLLSHNDSIWVADIYDFSLRSEAIEWCKKIQENDPTISFSNTDYSDAAATDSDSDAADSDSDAADSDAAYSDAAYSNAAYSNAAYSDAADTFDLIDDVDSIDNVIRPNHKKSLQDFLNDAQWIGHDSSFLIGQMHYYGCGVKQNYNEAYHYFFKAAEANNSNALYKLGEMYMKGHGVNQNINQAIELYIKAANSGDDAAPALLGELYHYNNQIQDFSKAFEWYEKVQGSNKSYALRGIGLLFEYGDGVDQDYYESVENYRQSMKLNNKAAHYNLALLYYRGKGVDQDYKKCFDLLNEAVKQESDINCTYVFVRTKNTSAATKTKENRIYSLENDNVLYGEVYYQLGIMYKNGEGTDQNPEKAKKCFLKAADYGNGQAKVEL